MGSDKTQFGLRAKFSITRDGETQYMEHYFVQSDPAIFNISNEVTMNDVFNHFIDQVKGEIEACSERGAGWLAFWPHLLMLLDTNHIGE